MSATAASTAPQNKSLEWMNRLRANPKIPLIVAGAAAIAIVVAMVLWAKSPDYRTLYSNLSDQDGGAIVTQLTQMNIPYRFADNGGALEVPADKVHELRLRLAQQGLPKGGAVGFELLDQEKFGISQFSEQVNYQRALEGELARTIETLGPVKSARVHLAMPKPSLFVREQKSPSASVTVNLEPGRALKYAADVEGRLQRRIEAILGPVVGSSNVHAQVTAQIDFSNKEQTEEQYAPNGDASRAVLRSRQINESEQVGGQYPGGVPGALSNQPAPANAAPISTPPANPQNGQQTNQQTTSTANSAGPRNSSRNETTNYEVDRTIRHTKLNTGDIQRLSVAVVVNYKTLPDGKPLPLTAEQMKQIEDLTREAMGFSEKRGDTLNVVNSPFNPVDETGGELPFWQQQAFFDQLMSAGRWLLVLIVAWLLWRKGVRPQLQRRAEAEKAALEQKNARPDEEEAVEVRLSKDEQMQQRRANQRMGAEVMSQRIREMSDNDPRVVALVIRGWMGNEHE